MTLAHRLLAPLALLLLTAAAPVQRYVVDPGGSAVSAKVGFLGIGSKTAEFPKMSGSAKITADRLQDLGIDVSLDARAIKAPDTVTLGRLRGESFFWVEKYPTIRFVGTSLVMSGARSGVVDGKLTARGVTKPVKLTVTFSKAPDTLGPDEAITIDGQTNINRRDFGMTAYSLVVGKTVTIKLKARMVPD